MSISHIILCMLNQNASTMQNANLHLSISSSGASASPRLCLKTTNMENNSSKIHVIIPRGMSEISEGHGVGGEWEAYEP
jgi:hypothetical protein